MCVCVCFTVFFPYSIGFCCFLFGGAGDYSLSSYISGVFLNISQPLLRIANQSSIFEFCSVEVWGWEGYC